MDKKHKYFYSNIHDIVIPSNQAIDQHAPHMCGFPCMFFLNYWYGRAQGTTFKMFKTNTMSDAYIFGVSKATHCAFVWAGSWCSCSRSCSLEPRHIISWPESLGQREPFNILFLFMFIICLQHSSMQYTHHVHAQYCGLKFDPRHGCSRSCFLL